MVPITSLWLPIVLSAVIVFIASALAWMVSPHHKNEWKGLPNEDAVRAALNAQQPAPGLYTIPFAMGGDPAKNPAVAKKLQEGPVGFLTLVRPRPMSMTPMMVQSVIYYLVVGVIVAYLTGRTLQPGTDYLHVFRVAGTTAWLAYGLGTVPDSIWFGRPWSTTLKQVLDALVYGCLTAGTFGWLWPR